MIIQQVTKSGELQKINKMIDNSFLFDDLIILFLCREQKDVCMDNIMNKFMIVT